MGHMETCLNQDTGWIERIQSEMADMAEMEDFRIHLARGAVIMGYILVLVQRDSMVIIVTKEVVFARKVKEGKTSYN